MNQFNAILQFIEIFLYSVLILTLIKRVICRGVLLNPFTINWKRFKVLLMRRYYYSDILLLIYSIMAFCNISNKLLNYTIDPAHNTRTFFWIFMHIILCTALIIRFRNSKPTIITHIQEDISDLFKQLFSKKEPIKH